ncbi:TIGR02452 family protein [Streptomyces sp. NPDC004111]|uniref:TIGR02452 family protein n=1 Tax=Streptomyces sp. NPDC004111 TaxID=3364690 RepID=UPI0036AAB388
MSARLRGIAKETETIVGEGRYTAPGGRTVSLAAALETALAGTRTYGPEPVPVDPDTDRATRFEVSAESSTEAARRLAGDATGPVAVLVFASARNPGGGYLNGAQAQEEAVCRSSALYACLLRAPGFYAHHRAERDVFYTDRVIHAPGVPVFRDDRGALLADPYTVGFLTSPAPNAGAIARNAPREAHRVPGVLVTRAGRVLETAAACGYRRLVLGAWGCGVFRNDPATVAGAFHGHLTGDGRFAGHFDEVVFAVLDRTGGGPALTAFRDAFAAQLQPYNSRSLNTT